MRALVDEARIVAQLHHPNIVEVHELGKVGDEYFIALEYVDGHDLASVLQRSFASRTPVPVGAACYLAAEVASALAYAHALCDGRGRPFEIVHRDVTPHNLMISRGGNVKLLDFGVAKAAAHLRDERTGTGVLKGKLAYLSPEQADGRGVDRRSDIFSLGVVLHECLAGARLFRGTDDLETLRLVREASVPAPSTVRGDVPAALDEVVRTMLARDPASRYASCDDLLAALQPLVHRFEGDARMLRAFVATVAADDPAHEPSIEIGRPTRATRSLLPPSRPTLRAGEAATEPTGAEATSQAGEDRDARAVVAARRDPSQRRRAARSLRSLKRAAARVARRARRRRSRAGAPGLGDARTASAGTDRARGGPMLESSQGRRQRWIALVALAWMGCMDDGAAPQPDVAALPPSSLISDAAHGGKPGFYWLSPLVSTPRHTGTFDGTLHPTVTVCLLGDNGCAQDLVTYTTGTGPLDVHVETAQKAYSVFWNSANFDVSPSSFYRVRVEVGGVLLGFLDVDVVPRAADLKKVVSSQYVGLVVGKPLLIRFEIDRGVVGSVTVSPATAFVAVEDTQQFAATVRDLHGEVLLGRRVTWSSSKKAIATVSSGGLATGVSGGTVTITATCELVSGAATLEVGPCKAGMVLCGKTCIDTSTDVANCGECAHACKVPTGGTATCVSGVCGQSCGSGTVLCSSACVDTQTDVENCGGCGVVCTAPTGVLATCVGGTCGLACPTGETLCGETCLDTSSDVANCGACGNVCPTTDGHLAGCVGGVCTQTCPATETDCSDLCVNEKTDVHNCGGCGIVCPPPGGGSAVCLDGICGSVCPSGRTLCGTSCVDLNTNAMNCGSCAHSCSAPAGGFASCSSGACVRTCPGSTIECDGICTDVSSSASHCGDCATVCPTPPGGTAECISGTCGAFCPSGTALCDGACIGIENDVFNCGDCHVVCPASAGTLATCVAGKCGLACPEGQTLCGAKCVVTSSDVDNCGFCGNVCPSDGHIPGCELGVCTKSCGPGETDCSNVCVDTQLDLANCGTCGNTCSPPTNGVATCEAGTCGMQCAVGETLCGTTCIPTLTDVNNCGSCGNVCPAPTGGTAGCQSGTCTRSCSTGETECSGVCINLGTSITNCGVCGRVCAPPTGGTAICVGGSCGLGCPGGTTLCGTACVDTGSDPSNCGRCGNACPVGSSCSSGTCTQVKVVFLTSTTFNGNLGGLSGADSSCNFRATIGGLPGTYKAWLSDSNGNSPATRMTHWALPYVLRTRTVVANNWDGLVSGTLLHAIDRTETGATSANIAVLTDTNGDGTAHLGPYDCQVWSSTTGTFGNAPVVGQSNRTDVGWTFAGQGGNGCGVGYALYCVQQ